jgi:hypothetical protein
VPERGPVEDRPATDVLSSGPEREPRGLRRWAVPLAAGVLAASAGAGWQLRQDGAEPSRRSASGSTSDRADLQGRVTGMLAEEGSGTATAQVTVDGTGGSAPSGRVTAARLVGPGFTPTELPEPVVGGLPAGVQPQAAVDCARAARERLSEADVVLTLLPASGMPREQRLPVLSSQVREAVLVACGLPDPRADLVVEASGSGDLLRLFVAGVPRSKDVLRLTDVTVPGFALEPVAGGQLPLELPPATGAFLAFQVRVERCAEVEPGAGQVVVRLAEQGQPVTVVAGPPVHQPQPGSHPVEPLLAGLAERSC